MSISLKKRGVKIMDFQFKIGAGGMITIVLLLAKLLGFFPYSYWYVFAPLLVAYLITFALITYAALVLSE